MTSELLYKFERELYKKGIELVSGIDEAGRGCLAGPVVAACVILKKEASFKYVDDSKKLTEKQRELALKEILDSAISIGVSFIDSKEIDKINIYQASKLAMETCINNMDIKPKYLLIDAMKIKTDIPFESIIKGDSKSVSIAAASIVAKTSRDAYMKEMDLIFPEYNFKSNKGYGTKDHLDALNKFGITEMHRMTYAPIREILDRNKLTLFD